MNVNTWCLSGANHWLHSGVGRSDYTFAEHIYMNLQSSGKKIFGQINQDEQNDFKKEIWRIPAYQIICKHGRGSMVASRIGAVVFTDVHVHQIMDLTVHMSLSVINF